MQLLIEKLKKVFFAVFPITVLVATINFTIVPVGSSAMIKFIIWLSQIREDFYGI